MARARRDVVVRSLRQRIVRALATGSLSAGDRVPSTREMARELDADPRLIADAYRQLEVEGLVELRPRSGIYVRGDAPSVRRASSPPASLLVDMLVDASIRGHSAPTLVRAMQDVVVNRAVRAVVIATTADQGLGIARELREDFGVDASAILAERLKGDSVPEAVKRAELLITTQAHASLVQSLSARFSRQHCVISVRNDIFENEWRLWQGEVAHVIVLDPRFRTLVQQFIRSTANTDHVQVHLVTGNLSKIHDDSPTYVTQAARAHLGKTKVPGTIIPPTRLLHEDCIRELWRLITDINLKAAERRNVSVT